MDSQSYPRPTGSHDIPTNQLDLRPDPEIDHDILHPKPVSDEKNVWFFWHTGYESMAPYNKRTVRGWYRRLSRRGWATRVIDRQPSSPSNISNFLDVHDQNNFPKAFVEDTIGGNYPFHVASDLVRFPLLLKYGGAYADVGTIQFGDLDRLWRETVSNPDSPFDIVCYSCEDVQRVGFANYFLVARPENPFFERCHRLLLKLWEGKNSSEGLARSPLLKGAPLLVSEAMIKRNGATLGPAEVSAIMSDFVLQGQVISMVMGLVDEEGGWNGPAYVVEHIYRIDCAVGSLLVNYMTGWDGPTAFRLLSLSLPKEGEAETEHQARAREIVEACLSKSFALKLYHGLIVEMLGETLGTLWRKNEGSDNVPHTYAHWLRYGAVHWEQDGLPSRLEFQLEKPLKRGPLLGDE